MINYLLYITILLLSNNNIAPFEYEKLHNPIILTGYCKNIKIIEWRDINLNNIDKKSIMEIDNICNSAIINFNKVINKHNIEKYNYKISILPFNPNKDGRNFRNLNDFIFRFDPKQNNIQSDDISGLYHRKSRLIFIRNDIFSQEFIKSMRHELFHALAYDNNIFKGKEYEEEKAAIAFETY